MKKKLKFLFIQPNWDRRYVVAFPTYEPLHGLLFAGILRDIADSVIFDRRFDTDENLIKLVKDMKPDWVGITIHTGGEISNIKSLAKIVKENCPQALISVGGQHATLLPEDFFNENIDIIGIGPGEETIRELGETMLANGDLSKISGIAIKKEKNNYEFTPPRIIKNGKLSWPEFDYSLINKKYKKNYGFIFENNRNNIYTATTSGCPHRCEFCSLWAAARCTFKYREASEVVRDIKLQPQTYVHLTDDNTFFNEENAMDIYRLLKKDNIKKKILAYARTDTIVNNTKLIERWKEIGLGALVVGMEAVSDSKLKAFNKKSSVDINIEAQKVLDRLGIECWAHFVITPDFIQEDFDELWEFVDKYNVTYPVYVAYTPVPGTPLFFEMKEKKKLTSFDYAYYNLQYMPVKTALPKEKWYENFWSLYLKSASNRTLLKRMIQSPQFHFIPAIGRAHIMGKKTYTQMIPNIKEQIHLEETLKYEEIEHTLLPSLRSDYNPVNYYNSISFKNISSQ